MIGCSTERNWWRVKPHSDTPGEWGSTGMLFNGQTASCRPRLME